MEFNSRKYQTFLYYSKLDNINEIPERSGNYYFFHYVNIPPTYNIDQIWKKLIEFSQVDFENYEEGVGQKFFYKIGELSFRQYNLNSVLGLSERRQALLYDYLSKDPKNITNFLLFFRDLCFTRPFYIGKAIKLRSRIRSHIEGYGSSRILNEIETRSIIKDNIWIAFEEIQVQEDDILNIFEEISQKFLKPSITDKFG